VVAEVRCRLRGAYREKTYLYDILPVRVEPDPTPQYVIRAKGKGADYVYYQSSSYGVSLWSLLPHPHEVYSTREEADRKLAGLLIRAHRQPVEVVELQALMTGCGGHKGLP
jgi:hypothetical protein